MLPLIEPSKFKSSIESFVPEAIADVILSTSVDITFWSNNTSSVSEPTPARVPTVNSFIVTFPSAFIVWSDNLPSLRSKVPLIVLPSETTLSSSRTHVVPVPVISWDKLPDKYNLPRFSTVFTPTI